MQPLRGYGSLSLGDLLQGIAPAPLSPPNVPGPWDASDPDPSSMMAAQANSMPPRQSGVTPDTLRALKQAMMRIAPYVPPDVLQQHYIRRIAELSNPTSETSYPVESYGNPFQTGDLLSGIRPAPLAPPNMPTAIDSPLVRAAMARLATSPAANGQVQAVRADDAALPVGDLASGITPAPLSAPNMPSVMDDPIVRASLARHAISPAANGHIQTIPLADPRFAITTPSLSAPNIASTNGGPPSDEQVTQDDSGGALGSLRKHLDNSGGWLWPGFEIYGDINKGDYYGAALDGALDVPFGGAVGQVVRNPNFGKYAYEAARWVPLLGAGLDVWDDIDKGDYAGAAFDGALGLSDLTVGGALARGALRYGLKGLWKNGSKTYAATRPWLGKLLNLPPNTEVHHALVHQKNKLIPEWLLNHQMNLVPMYGGEVGGRTTRQLHNAVHGWGKYRFAPDNPVLDYLLRIQYGWPNWAKVAIPAAGLSGGLNAYKDAKAMGETGAANPDWQPQLMFLMAPN